MPRQNRFRAPALVTAMAMTTTLALQAAAQTTPGYAGGYPSQPAPPGPMRQAFAQSLASVVGNVGGALAVGLTGAMTNWLNRKAQGRTAMANGGGYYPTTNGPMPNGYAPSTPPPYYDPGTAPPLPPPGYPGDPQGGGYPNAGAPPIPGQAPGGYPGDNGPVFDASGGAGGAPANPGTDPSTGYPGTPGYPNTGGNPNSGGYPNPGGYPNTGGAGGYPNPGGYPATNGGLPDASGGMNGGMNAGAPGAVYAGIAYEVYALTPAGPQRVDPATHSFANGERFNVYYTPTLPGQVDVYNINPQGQQSHVDTVAVAGGQLITLGPYEFRDQPGNETLLIELAPCSSRALLDATRTIVKSSSDAAPTLNLAECSGPNTRGLKRQRLKTRTIVKSGTEQGTTFALDPLSRAEYSSGNVAPRQISITLMHR